MKHILCFGDSNTWGANPNNQLRWEYGQRWPGILSSLLGAEYNVIEEGLSGRTSVFEDDITPDRAGIKVLDLLLETHSPLDLVIMMLGTNDTKSYFNAEAKVIALGISKVVERARNHCYYPGFKSPEILLVSPVLIASGAQEASGCVSFTEESVKKSRELSPLLEQVAKLASVHFFDAATVASPGPDCVHLDAKDHQALAEALEKKVRSIIG